MNDKITFSCLGVAPKFLVVNTMCFVNSMSLYFTASARLYGFLLLAMLATPAFGSIYHGNWIDLNKNGREDIYENPQYPITERVSDLLSQMTLAEKIGQLHQAFFDPKMKAKLTAAVREGKVGSLLVAGKMLENPVERNALQRCAVEQSRLGIPLIFGHDSIHGFRTVFPIPLGLSCAWNPKLFEQVEAISARESAAVGIDWTFAPMINLARDPRWGRIAEGFGEDPWLASLYTAACVRGFQGTNVADPDRLVACLKHFVGYGAAEGGRDYNTTEISDYTLWNDYLPAFKAGIDAGALTVMSAFNCLNGTPATADRYTLTDILRDKLKFSGFVVSDWDSVSELIPQGVAADDAQAARLAITAGVDMEMVSTTFDTLAQQVKEGIVPESVINKAVSRILRVKFMRGLFNRPYVNPTLYKTAFLRPDAIALAREAAAQSCVLLKNRNSALPLTSNVKSIALIGPLANAPAQMLGCWSAPGRASDAVSLAAGLRARLGSNAKFTVVAGCGLPGIGVTRNNAGTLKGKPKTVAGDHIPQAVAAARASDVVILALGEPDSWSGENASRSHLTLPGHQLQLCKAVVAVGKPVIVVLFNGRPLAVPELDQKAAAILDAWYPGVQAGSGVADVLFGDVPPSGHLTTSFPRCVGQVPVYYDHLNTGRPDKGKYVDGLRTPLFPFGFGLTYTKFSFGKVKLSSHTMKLGGRLTAQVKVTNVGSRVGEEVAQLYVRDLFASEARPIRELKGFKRITLKPGQTRDLVFHITDRDLGFYNAKGCWLVEPGRFQLWITKDSASGQPVDFDLTK